MKLIKIGGDNQLYFKNWKSKIQKSKIHLQHNFGLLKNFTLMSNFV